MEHFQKLLQDIMDQGGEGVILRDPRAEFVAGRSSGYLKHKVYCFSLFFIHVFMLCSQKFRDAEAKIVGPAGYQRWECELYDNTNS